MKNRCKFDARKRDAKIMKNDEKLSQNGNRNREKSDKIRVQKNIEISSKNVTPAYPAFGPLSNPLLEENLQKNTNQQQKTARGGTSEREPAIRAQI